jgi:hypothetical protein
MGGVAIWLIVAGADAVADIIRWLKPVETKAQFEARWERERKERHRAAVAVHMAEDRKEQKRIDHAHYRAKQRAAAQRIKSNVAGFFK